MTVVAGRLLQRRTLPSYSMTVVVCCTARTMINLCSRPGTFQQRRTAGKGEDAVAGCHGRARRFPESLVRLRGGLLLRRLRLFLGHRGGLQCQSLPRSGQALVDVQHLEKAIK